METANTNSSTTKPYFAIALIVLVACFALFYLDKDIHKISDLFLPGNLFGLIILYFVPTSLVCMFFFKRLSKRNTRSESLLLSLVIGVPLSLLLIIVILNGIKQLFV